MFDGRIAGRGAMTGDLHSRFAGTRAKLRRLLWCRGVAWLAAVLVGWAVFAGVVDYWFHVSSGLRLVFLAAAALSALFVGWRFLGRPLALAVSDLDLALRVERRHPELMESLSATVSFQNASADDALAGSVALRRAVVRRAVAQSERVHFDEIVDPTATRRAVWTASAAAAVAALLALVDPASAAVALQRLCQPFADVEWPKRTALAFVSLPTRVAKGDPFAFEIEARGVVPGRIDVLFRFADGQTPPPTAATPSAGSANRFVGGLPAAMQPFHVRVRGGDAETDWIAVDVVPAPDVESLSVTVSPPAYTNLPTVHHPVGRGHVDAVVGANVRVLATSNKPIVAGRLLWQSGERTDGVVSEDGASCLASFSVVRDDSYRIVLEDAGGMTNEHRSPKPYRVKAIQDAPPVVKLESPAGDADVTPKARIPLRAMVRDDFGVQDVVLAFRIETTEAGRAAGGAAPDFERVPLTLDPQTQRWTHDWNLSSLPLSLGAVVVLKVAARDFRDDPGPNVGESREVRLRIVSEGDLLRQMEAEQRLLREEIDRLKKLQEAALSQTRDLHEKASAPLQATDADREKLQNAETIQRRVREKTSESDGSIQKRIRDLLDRLADNQVDDLDAAKRLTLMDSELSRLALQHLPEIEQSLTEARKSIGLGGRAPSRSDAPVEGASPSASQSRRDGDADAAPPADGQAVDDQPSDADAPARPPTPSDDGEPAQARRPSSTPNPDSLQPPESLDRPPDASAQPEDAADAPSAPSREAPPGADGADGSQPNAQPQSRTSEALGRARERQRQVVDALDAMLDQLNRWESVADVVNEARDLERKQLEASRRVDQIAQESLGKSEAELTKEEKAALAQTAAAQEELRRQLGRLEQKMSRQEERTKESDPAASQAIEEARRRSRESNLAGKMAEAAGDIRRNRLADAGQRQSEIAGDLRRLVESLENRREQELKKLVQDLKQAEQDLQEIREAQRRLRKETQDAESLADPRAKREELARLQRRQQDLQQRAEEFARRLSRLQAKAASSRSGRAAGRMADASRALQQGEDGQAGERQDESLDDLQQAQEELAQARREAEESLAGEQLAKVADAIRDVHRRQVGLIDEASRLDAARANDGAWTRGQIQSLLGLARAERGLAEESAALRERLSEAKVFALVIEEAADEMRAAAGKLAEKTAGPEVQRPMNRAARKFAQLLESLRPDPAQNARRRRDARDDPGAEQGQGGGGGAVDGQDGIPGLAQIKLLKGLQEEILEETRELAQAKPEAGWGEDERRRFARLSQRQGRLAELILELTEPDDDEPPLAPEDDE
jgi:hypothetical protein